MAIKQSINQTIPELMSSLRTLMAKEMTSQNRLKSILILLCEQIHMPTSAFYMKRAGDVLERSILVGRPLNLPIFIRIGETLLGQVAITQKTQVDTLGTQKTVLAVPVIRRNELVGILTLLSRKKEPLSREIIETVENVAMVMAEFLTPSKNDNPSDPLKSGSLTRTFEGTELVRGFALGEVLLHRRLEVTGSILAKHPDHEQKRLTLAFSKVERNIKTRLKRPTTPSEEKELFETYLLLLGDTEWKSKIASAIATGLTAQAALRKVGDELVDKMYAIADPYLRERAHDLQDVMARLMQALIKKSGRKRIQGNKIWLRTA